jgi:Carboxypeptidase regulatory-like domain
MSSRKVPACWLMIVCAALMLAPASFAQSFFATLTGTVSDVSGAVVPGATVIIQDANSKVTRQVKTNSSGYFSASNLPAGTYNVTAEANGFEKWRASGIVLQGSDNKTINIPMKIGATNEVVEVNASAGELVITDS